jgi:antitoxin CptB
MDVIRKRLLFRARHMGTNENDIFFGEFATENLSCMSKDQLDRFEKLMEVNDPDLFLWISGAKPVPDAYRSDVMDMLRGFTLTRAKGGDQAK